MSFEQEMIELLRVMAQSQVQQAIAIGKLTQEFVALREQQTLVLKAMADAAGQSRARKVERIGWDFLQGMIGVAMISLMCAGIVVVGTAPVIGGSIAFAILVCGAQVVRMNTARKT